MERPRSAPTLLLSCGKLGSPALEKKFARAEVMIPVKCNQHPWMKMYVNVVKSPFYAVTGPDGKFEIKGLPPGEYGTIRRIGRLG